MVVRDIEQDVNTYKRTAIIRYTPEKTWPLCCIEAKSVIPDSGYSAVARGNKSLAKCRRWQ